MPRLSVVAYVRAAAGLSILLCVSLCGQLGRGEDRAASAEFPAGKSKVVIDLEGTKFDVFTYRPQGYKDGPLILVFHGMDRNAEDYRDNAIELADRNGALIAAPLFDSDRFPSRQYQRGGLVTAEGQTRAASERTWHFVTPLAEAIRHLAGRPKMPYYLIGHSGGAQFLSRLAGFQNTEARRIVAANPGSLLFPTTEQDYPYGFGTLPAELRSDAVIKNYLAQPLTIYQGADDNVKDDNLDDSPPANIQGGNRWERGQHAFQAAQHLAKKNGWPCNWQIVPAKGVGHDGHKMFASPACDVALFGDKHK